MILKLRWAARSFTKVPARTLPSPRNLSRLTSLHGAADACHACYLYVEHLMLVSPAVPPKSNKISLSGGAAPPEKLFLRKSGGHFRSWIGIWEYF